MWLEKVVYSNLYVNCFYWWILMFEIGKWVNMEYKLLLIIINNIRGRGVFFDFVILRKIK